MIHSIDHSGYVTCGPYYGMPATVITVNGSVQSDCSVLDGVFDGRWIHFVCASLGQRGYEEICFVNDLVTRRRHIANKMSVQIRPGIYPGFGLIPHVTVSVDQEDYDKIFNLNRGVRNGDSVSVRGWPGGMALSVIPAYVEGNFLVLDQDEIGQAKIWVQSSKVPWRIVPFVDMTTATTDEIELSAHG